MARVGSGWLRRPGWGNVAPGWEELSMERVPEGAGRLLEELLGIMARLREPGGCPWDREQTPASLRPYAVEEAAELAEAVEEGDDRAIVEELGDLLLQVVFHARIAQEEGRFDVRDAIRAITGKLVHRHPHVFAGLEVADSQAVLRNWERLKSEEKTDRRSALDGVPRRLEPLLRAHRLQEKAARQGFDWPAPGPVLDKVAEELGEVAEAARGGNAADVAAELGDLLFATVNLARHLGVRPEDALQQASDRFARRFRGVEERLQARGERMADQPLARLDEFWEEAKGEEREKS